MIGNDNSNGKPDNVAGFITIVFGKDGHCAWNGEGSLPNPLVVNMLEMIKFHFLSVQTAQAMQATQQAAQNQVQIAPPGFRPPLR